MNFETAFKEENIDLLFSTETHSENFIAVAQDRFSEYMDRNEFSREWARSFPSGRYVITIYQRYSVFIAGKQIWRNNEFLNEVGKDSRYRSPYFVIALDKELNYMIPSWGRPLQSHIVMDEKNPLQAQIFPSVERAELVAQKYAEQGFKVAVLL
jgi:hypothetical protein